MRLLVWGAAAKEDKVSRTGAVCLAMLYERCDVEWTHGFCSRESNLSVYTVDVMQRRKEKRRGKRLFGTMT